MRLAVVNPNTTASMTETIAAAAKGAASLGTEIIARTSSMGPVSIEGYYDEALSVPGLLVELGKAETAGADAAIIACFDDTGLDAARALCDIPVIGICEAAVVTAAFLAKRFTIVTTLDRSRIPIEELCRRYGVGDRTVVRASNIPVLSLEDPDSGARDRLRTEIHKAIDEDHAEAIVLGCAGMADLARTLQSEFGIPVIDGVGAAVKQAEALVGLGLRTSKRGTYATPIRKAYTGAMKEFAPA
jgi:allantoin racemase